MLANTVHVNFWLTSPASWVRQFIRNMTVNCKMFNAKNYGKYCTCQQWFTSPANWVRKFIRNMTQILYMSTFEWPARPVRFSKLYETWLWIVKCSTPRIMANTVHVNNDWPARPVRFAILYETWLNCKQWPSIDGLDISIWQCQSPKYRHVNQALYVPVENSFKLLT